jgi:hypothetical protein
MHQSEWVVRLTHELKSHLAGSSVWFTLTYGPDHLPKDGSLSKEEVQKFIERLRYYCRSNGWPENFRYFIVGEYGKEGNAPHYHGFLFGLPTEIFQHKVIKGKPCIDSSGILTAWGKGHIALRRADDKQISYTIKYTLKHKTDDRQIESYYRFDSNTGKQWVVRPEFMLCSRRPGIGRRWFERYLTDFMPAGRAIVKGKEVCLPRSYRRYIRETNPALYEKYRVPTVMRAKELENHPDNTPERRATIDEVKTLRHRGNSAPKIPKPFNPERRRFVVDQLVANGYLPSNTDKEKLYEPGSLQKEKGRE